MAERLQTFVLEHPEFFEMKDGYWRLGANVSGLMERYARAYNKEEFERMLVLVEEARIKERERLQAEIDQWTQECLEQQQKAEQIEAQLQDLEGRLNASKNRLEKAEAARIPKPVPQRSWYHSGVVFSLLALSGVYFFYLGLILNETVTLSYVVAGVSCFAIAYYLQSGPSNPNGALDSTGPTLTRIVNEENGFIKIALIKRATLAERKKIAYRTVAAYNRKINVSNSKLDTLNG